MRFVYAIGFVGERFVMVRHRGRAWEMPGGRVETGESPGQAVGREFLEETGMHFVPVADMPIGDGRVFFGLADGEPTVRKGEVAEVGLFDELPAELSFPDVEYRPLLEHAREAVREHVRDRKTP